METIAFRTVQVSVHLITIHFATYAVTSPVTVKVVFEVLVGVPGIAVQNHPPEAEGVCQVAAVPEVAVSTCPEVGAVAALTLTVVVALFNASA